jgi:hypothetical protein
MYGSDGWTETENALLVCLLFSRIIGWRARNAGREEGGQWSNKREAAFVRSCVTYKINTPTTYQKWQVYQV